MAHLDVWKLASESGQSLPGDYVALTSRRLAIAAAISAAIDLIYIVLYRTVWEGHAVGLLTGIASLVSGLLTVAYLTSGARDARRVAAAGISLELMLALSLAFSEATSLSYSEPSSQVPWGTVVIMLFPFLLPTRPRTVLAASLGAAAMTPLAMGVVFALTQRPWPNVAISTSAILPPFLGALLAWAPTNAIYGLGVAVQKERRLGSYELSERLGGGGMGEVWRARHRLLARPAAVKLIKPEVLGAKDEASRARVLARFEEEAQVTATLDSQHTVELYDFGISSRGELFYVMELLDGMDAETLVQRFGPLPSERVVYLLLQACDSLEDAHRRGLIHRDIKPANLFVTRKGVEFDFLKVLDFGLVKRWQGPRDEEASRSLASLRSAEQTMADQIVGTPAFLAPEAVVGGDGVDQRADLYALGCVSYWLLTGSMVFDDRTPVEMVISHVTKTPPAPSSRTERPIAPELERITLQCLAKDREQRPQSARELRHLLASISFAEPWSRERGASWWEAHLTSADTRGLLSR